jgi:hypothetical protein
LVVGAGLLILDASQPPLSNSRLTEGITTDVTRAGRPTSETVLDIEPTPTSAEVIQETIETAVSAAGAAPSEASSWILIISENGDPTVLAENVPFSTQSLVVDRRGDVYFTCAAGYSGFVRTRGPEHQSPSGCPCVLALDRLRGIS